LLLFVILLNFDLARVSLLGLSKIEGRILEFSMISS